MTPDHIDVHIPHLPAWHDIMIHLCEGKGVRHTSYCGFSRDPGFRVSNFFLIFHYTNYQTLSDFEGLHWM